MTSKTIKFSYGDRNFEVRKQGGDVRIEISDARNFDGSAGFGYIHQREDGVKIVQALVEALGLTQNEVFPKPEPEPEPEPKRKPKVGDKIRLTGRLWGMEVYYPRKGSVVTVESINREGNPHFTADGGRHWEVILDGKGRIYDADWAGEIFDPQNARDVIDTLPVGATFRLKSAGRTFYARKVSDTEVESFGADDTFRKGGHLWDLVKLPGLFTGWAVDEFAEVEPRKVNENREVFDALPTGGKFRIKDGLGLIRIKVGKDTFLVEGGTEVLDFDDSFPERGFSRIEAVQD